MEEFRNWAKHSKSFSPSKKSLLVFKGSATELIELCNNCRCDEITDEGVQKLGEALEKLQCLQNITLHFSEFSYKIMTCLIVVAINK